MKRTRFACVLFAVAIVLALILLGTYSVTTFLCRAQDGGLEQNILWRFLDWLGIM